MKPGERVDVRTPNAIAGVRGTVLIVETQGKTSSVTVLTGLVDVVRVDPATGRAVGAITPVGARQTVTVRNNVLPPRSQAITPQRSQQLSEEFTPPMRRVTATAVMPVKEEVARATTLLNEMLPGASPDPGSRAVANTGSTDTVAPAAQPGSTLATSTASRSGTAPSTTLVPTTTSLSAPPTSSLSMTSPVPTTTLTTSTISPAKVPTTTLLQPVVQPVAQNVVQPVLQTGAGAVTRLLK